MDQNPIVDQNSKMDQNQKRDQTKNSNIIYTYQFWLFPNAAKNPDSLRNLLKRLRDHL